MIKGWMFIAGDTGVDRRAGHAEGRKREKL